MTAAKKLAEEKILAAVREVFAEATEESIPGVIEAYSGSDSIEEFSRRAGVFEIPAFSKIANRVEEYLSLVAKEAAHEAVKNLAIDDKSIFDIANTRAAAYAHTRAAELVGRRWKGDRLVDNPDSKWSITQSTRDGLREKIEQAYEEGWTPADLRREIIDSYDFSDARADTIARTEMARASSQGTLEGWKSSGMVKGKRWHLSEDHPEPADECDEAAEAGVIDIDDDFPGVDTDAPPGHPSCWCVMSASMTGPDEEDELEAFAADDEMKKVYLTEQECRDMFNAAVKESGLTRDEYIRSESICQDGWHGVDLDGTLAEYHGFEGPTVIGAPVLAMVQRVQNWLSSGEGVKIMTARVSQDPDGSVRAAVIDWCRVHVGTGIPVTNAKDFRMIDLWDDRAVQVRANTGIPVGYVPVAEKVDTVTHARALVAVAMAGSLLKEAEGITTGTGLVAYDLEGQSKRRGRNRAVETDDRAPTDDATGSVEDYLDVEHLGKQDTSVPHGWTAPSAADWMKRSYGGVVLSNDGKLLLCEPRDHHEGMVWTWPKGSLVSIDEPVDVCALREVSEETGHDCVLVEPLPGTFSQGWSFTNLYVMRSVRFSEKNLDGEMTSTRWALVTEAEELLNLSTNEIERHRDLAILRAAAVWLGERAKTGKLSAEGSSPAPFVKVRKDGACYVFTPAAEGRYQCDQCPHFIPALRQPAADNGLSADALATLNAAFGLDTFGRCALLHAEDRVAAFGTCSYWVYGAPDAEQTPRGFLTKKEAGYTANRAGYSCVRCTLFDAPNEDCRVVDRGSDGDTPGKIVAGACCANWTSAELDEDTKFAKTSAPWYDQQNRVASLFKGSPDQPRDEHGRWTAGGADIAALARIGAERAKMGLGGTLTIGREARQAALRAGANAAAGHAAHRQAREAARRALAGAPPKAVNVRGPKEPANPVAAAPIKNTDARENALREGIVTGMKPLGGGVSVTRLVTMSNGEKAIFKPETGEPHAMRSNISHGFQTEREAGAWEVAKHVGMQDMMPPVVVRTVNGERGSIMGYVCCHNAVDSATPYGKNPSDVARAAAFDYVIGNEDRHMGNWRLDNSSSIKLIDHGLSFPDKKEYGSASNHRFVQQAAKSRDISTDTIHALGKTYSDNKAAIVSSLRGLGLPAKSVQGVSDRIDKLAASYAWSDLLTHKDKF